MLRFFRQIRQRLFNENPPNQGSGAGRFSKYLVYAVGEIILVVLGILIALQVNDWNESRLSKAEMSKIYVSIIDDLENDQRDLAEILPDFQWKIQVIQRIVEEPPSPEKWTANDSLFYSFSSFADFEIGNERFELLKTKLPVDEQSRILNNRITDFYKKHATDIGVRTHEANMSYHRNFAYWEENEPWLSLAMVDGDFSKLGEHAANNPIFRNKLAWYRIMLSRLKESLLAYQMESAVLADEIRSYLETAESAR